MPQAQGEGLVCYGLSAPDAPHRGWPGVLDLQEKL